MSNPNHHHKGLHPLIRERWSPRAFSDQSVDADDLSLLLEAARWAPSCYNDQPWHFLVAQKHQTDEFATMASCLVPANREWADKAALLMITVIRETFSHNGAENGHAAHDLGLAVAQLTLQASALGLGVHQMAGFDPDLARELYRIPKGYRAVSAIAVGHPGDPESLPEPLRKAETTPGERRGTDEFVFSGRWGTPLTP